MTESGQYFTLNCIAQDAYKLSLTQEAELNAL